MYSSVMSSGEDAGRRKENGEKLEGEGEE